MCFREDRSRASVCRARTARRVTAVTAAETGDPGSRDTEVPQGALGDPDYREPPVRRDSRAVPALKDKLVYLVRIPRLFLYKFCSFEFNISITRAYYSQSEGRM